jgi:hypothetical protein
MYPPTATRGLTWPYGTATDRTWATDPGPPCPRDRAMATRAPLDRDRWTSAPTLTRDLTRDHGTGTHGELDTPGTQEWANRRSHSRKCAHTLGIFGETKNFSPPDRAGSRSDTQILRKTHSPKIWSTKIPGSPRVSTQGSLRYHPQMDRKSPKHALAAVASSPIAKRVHIPIWQSELDVKGPYGQEGHFFRWKCQPARRVHGIAVEATPDCPKCLR